MQQYTSANTSVNKTKMPRLFKAYKFESNSNILDYGCGKYTRHIKKFLKEKGCFYIGMDKFNQSQKQNQKAIDFSINNRVDYITCSNVLNVIKEDEIIFNIVREIREMCNPNTKVIFSIYQGKKDGIGRVTKKDCYQRNEITTEYLKFVTHKFSKFTITSNMLICEI